MTQADSGSSEAQVIRDPQLAAILTDPVARRYFTPFIARTSSVKAAADEVGCSLDAMLYRVRRFLQAGLLEVVDVQPRHGRAMKLYRSRADAYFIPHEATPFATLEERMYATAAPTLRAWARSAARRLQAREMDGVRLFRNAFGEVWSQSAAHPDDPGTFNAEQLADPQRSPHFDVSTELRLSEAEARALQADLFALFQAWQARQGSEVGELYLLDMHFFQPLPE